MTKKKETKAQADTRRAKYKAKSDIASSLGMTIKEYIKYAKVQKLQAKEEKIEADKEAERAMIEERIQNKVPRITRLTFDHVKEIFELERGESDKTLRYLLVTENTIMSTFMARDLYTMLVKNGENKILFRQNNSEIHVNGSTKFKFICTSKLSKAYNEVNHYDKAIYYKTVTLNVKIKDNE